MRKNYHSMNHFSKYQMDDLAKTSTSLLKLNSQNLALKFPSYKKFSKKKKDKNLYNTKGTFFIKKKLIMDSIENPESDLNEIWEPKNIVEKNCSFFPFIQERDHLNRLIKEAV